MEMDLIPAIFVIINLLGVPYNSLLYQKPQNKFFKKIILKHILIFTHFFIDKDIEMPE